MFSDMLGWEEGSWGYHSDDGNSYESRPTGNPFGPAYDKGGVVGCGVNFEKETAFFTLNGKVIGEYSWPKSFLLPFFSFFSSNTTMAFGLVL